MTYPQSRAQAPFDPAFDPALEPDPYSAPHAAPDPAQARFLARIRWFMLISGFATVLGIAVVIGVIGYRLFHGEGSVAPDVTALLPKGAKIIGTAVAGDRIAVIVDAGGSVEVRTFDLKTLRAAGRLKFSAEP
jgi:hypothetical protein